MYDRAWALGADQALVPSYASHTRRRLRLAALAAATLACALPPSGAHAAETGIVPDITWGTSSKTQDRTARKMQDVGAQWARLNISWSDWVEPSDGQYSNSALSHFDRGINLSIAAGYRVMITVEESPSWARDGSNKNSPPRDNAELAEFMSFIANRYKDKVEAYQVWNESNLLWAWPSGPNPAGYAQMLRAVAPAIRAADPSAKVVFAGISRNEYQYLEGVYDAMPDIGNYFDVMATHPYVLYGGSPEEISYDENGRIANGTFSGYRELRRTMEAHGDIKPIWLTEFGWSTTTDLSVPQNLGVSPQTQADYLKRAYDCLAQDPYVEVALWYSFRNEFWENDANTWVAQLGLLTTDFAPKPAYYALKNYVPGSGSCTYGGSAAPIPAPEPEPAPAPDSEPMATPSTTDPEPMATPSTTDPEPTEEPVVSSSTVRSSAMLAVTRARLRRGRLVVNGRVAPGVRGRVEGFVRLDYGKRGFHTRIDDGGMIHVDRRFSGAGYRSTARVMLRYVGNASYEAQHVTLEASRRDPRLHVEQADALASAQQTTKVRGSVVRDARGPVVLHVSYRTGSGLERMKTKAKIRRGQFRHALELPADASDAVLRVVYQGDRERGIAGESVALPLRFTPSSS